MNQEEALAGRHDYEHEKELRLRALAAALDEQRRELTHEKPPRATDAVTLTRAWHLDNAIGVLLQLAQQVADLREQQEAEREAGVARGEKEREAEVHAQEIARAREQGIAEGRAQAKAEQEALRAPRKKSGR